MSVLDNFFYKVIARIGLRKDLPALDPAEIAFATDVSTFSIGDGTSVPLDIVSTKSTVPFDLTSSPKITMPGNLVFDKNKPGQINGVDFSGLNKGNGILIRTGDNKFISANVTSTDNTIIISGGDGSTGDIDILLNLNNPALLNLINSSERTIYIGSTPPNNANSGDDFFDSDEDILYKRVGDETTGAWVDYSS